MAGMTQARTVIDAIGREKLAEALGVGQTAISNAAVDGKMPAAWYGVVRDFCKEIGEPCPLELFKFKGRPNSESAAA